jgi:hypothetical protein
MGFEANFRLDGRLFVSAIPIFFSLPNHIVICEQEKNFRPTLGLCIKEAVREWTAV